MYTGIYFGAKFVNYVYEPTGPTTAHLFDNFRHKWSVGQYVRFRESHKRTDAGTIQEVAYSSEKNGGGTIKIYKLRKKWICESLIKALME